MHKFIFTSLVIFLFSCSSGSQKASHIETKGITCDGVNNNGSIIVSGETSVFADRSQDSSQKDAYVYSSQLDKLFSIGNKVDGFRLDQITASSKSVVASGYGGQDRKAIICGFTDKLNKQWCLVSDSLEAFEEPVSAMDDKGNYLVVNKNTSAQPYYGYFTLVASDGKVLWTQCADHIDLMSDIIALKNGQFFVCFKQKGAYIDGGTGKKYYMATGLWVTIEGNIVQKYKFLIDREKVIDFNLNKAVEDSKGNIYLFGAGQMLNNKADLLVIKINSTARVQWSYTYSTGKELSIKSADIDSKDNIVIAADSYGKAGGFLLAGIDLDGKILWNTYSTTTPYEQIKNVYWDKEDIKLIFDKTLNAGVLTCSNKGKCCIGNSSLLDLKATNADVQLSPNNAEFEPTACRWNPIELQMQVHNNPKWIDDCK